MKTLRLQVLLVIFFHATSVWAQFETREWNAVVDFSADQKDHEKDIQEFLQQRQREVGHVSNLLMVVDPFGRPYDSASFKTPKFFGDQNTANLPKQDVVFLAERIVPSSQRFYFYNNGQTLIYCYEKEVTVMIMGNKNTDRETKLETYVRHNGKWIMAAVSGTFIKSPK